MQQIASWESGPLPGGTGPWPDSGARAAIAPHAGWSYSGALAWSAWRAALSADTVVILGGHRPAASPILVSMDDGIETPSGFIKVDAGFRAALLAMIKAVPDSAPDNTIETHLPFAANRFPDAGFLLARVPNDGSAVAFGELLADVATELGRSVFVLGSSDLTHYGPAYDFEPGGHGSAGKTWARQADQRIIKAFMAMDAAAVLAAAAEGAACSAGAAVAAMAFARKCLATRPVLLGHHTSDAVVPAESHVGYCSVAYY
jgi:hypothetical protein